MENYDDVWHSSMKDAELSVMSDPNTYCYAHDAWAYSSPDLKALKMVDMTPVSQGFGLQKNSEFLDLFKHQMIKLAEVGILNRMKSKWPDTSRNEEFEMAQPAALGFNNVLFPFTLLAAGSITAFAFFWLEHLRRKALRYHKAKKQFQQNLTTST